MTTYQLTEVFRDAVITGFKVAMPILLISMLVGLLVAIFQAATSINEQTLTFVPKLIVIGLTLIVLGGWMMQELIDFVHRLFELMASIV